MCVYVCAHLGNEYAHFARPFEAENICLLKRVSSGLRNVDVDSDSDNDDGQKVG